MPAETTTPAVPFRAQLAARQQTQVRVNRLLDLGKTAMEIQDSIEAVHVMQAGHDADPDLTQETRRQAVQWKWRAPFWIMVVLTSVLSGVAFAPDTARLVLGNLLAVLPSLIPQQWHLMIGVLLVEIFVCALLVTIKSLVDIVQSWRALQEATDEASETLARDRWRWAKLGALLYLGCVFFMMAVTASNDRVKALSDQENRALQEQARALMNSSVLPQQANGDYTVVSAPATQRSWWTWIGENVPKVGIMLILALAHATLLFVPTTPFGPLPLAMKTPDLLAEEEARLSQRFDAEIATASALHQELEESTPHVMPLVTAGLGGRVIAWINQHRSGNPPDGPETPPQVETAPTPTSQTPAPAATANHEEMLDAVV